MFQNICCTRRGLRTFLAAAMVAIFMGLAVTTIAQELTAVLFGTVRDSTGGVLPGATIEVTSAQLIGGSRIVVSDDAGQWRVPRLLPGTYAVQASLPGFQTLTVEQITMDSGVSFDVPVTLELSTIEETLTVTSEAAVIDTRKSVTTYTVDTNLIREIPIERTYADVLTTMPGVTTGSRYTYSLTQAVHGSSVRDNDYLIDGQSTKHPSGYSGTEISIESLELTQASTSGISAEFGQASGGVFSFITKSGGDDFAGSAYAFIVDESVQSTNIPQGLTSEQNAIVRDTNFGGNLGGPIVKQKLWFFLDLNRATNELAQANFPAPSTRTRLGHDANVHEQKRLSLVKGTWQVLPNSRFSYTFNYQDRWMRPSNPGSAYRFDERAWRKQFWKPKTHSAQWTSVIGDSVIFDAQWGWLKVNEDNTYPFGSYDASEVHGYTDRGSGVNYGTWDRLRGRFDGRDHWDVRSSLSYFTTGLGGEHDLKFGFHQEKGWMQRWRVIPDGLRQYLDSPKTCFSLDCAVPDQIRIYNQPTDTQSEWRVVALYAQDSWNLPNNVTLNLGVRYEFSNGWTPKQSGGCDLEPNGFSPDYDGNNVSFPRQCWFPTYDWPARPDVITFNTIAPRIGANWDVTGEGNFVVKVSGGRWYDKISGVGSGNPNSSRYARYDWNDCRDAGGNPIHCEGLPVMNGNLHFEDGEQGRFISNNVKSPAEYGDTQSHDPNLQQPYVDSVNLGFEFGVGTDFSVGVTGVYKKSGDLYSTVDQLRPFDQAYNEVSVTNPVNGQSMNIFLLKPDFTASESLRTNSDLAKREYTGLEFVVRRRFRDGWQFFGSYTLGNSTGTLGTHFNDSFSLNATNPNALINNDGPASLDARHLLKFSTSWVGPYEINFGAQYLGQSGFPVNGLVGSRMPGATFYQFQRGIDYPTNSPNGVKYRESRVDVSVEKRGTHRLDFQNILNLRVDKFFDIGKNGRNMRVGIILDVLNAFNSGAVTHIQSQRFGLTNYLLPEAIIPPRRARLGLRFMF